MRRFSGADEIYSALFIDFDTIHGKLSEHDPALARIFATCPHRWFRWIESHALRMMYGDNIRRRILKKTCYMNSHRYADFRPFFLRSGFQVVECFSHPGNGKTNASVLLTIDCFDILHHTVDYDEIILLSSDADLTPLLLRIQEHAKRSLMLAIGYVPPAFTAACSWRIREDWFISQALEENRLDEESFEERVSETRCEETKSSKKTYDQRDLSEKSSFSSSVERKYGNQQTEKNLTVHLPVSKRIKLVEIIRQLVNESNVPITLPSIAQVLQHEQESSTDWFGAGTLRELLALLDLSPLAFSKVEHGYVYDPVRHEIPEKVSRHFIFQRDYPDLYDFAVKVHELTDVPLLTPLEYEKFMRFLSEEISANGFSKKYNLLHLEERCDDEQLAIQSEQIHFLLEAIDQHIEADLLKKNKTPSPYLLSNALLERTADLCHIARMSLSETERKLLLDWFGQKNL